MACDVSRKAIISLGQFALVFRIAGVHKGICNFIIALYSNNEEKGICILLSKLIDKYERVLQINAKFVHISISVLIT